MFMFKTKLNICTVTALYRAVHERKTFFDSRLGGCYCSKTFAFSSKSRKLCYNRIFIATFFNWTPPFETNFNELRHLVWA